jgi:hypothetical protein
MTLIEDGDVVQTFAQGDRGDHDLFHADPSTGALRNLILINRVPWASPVLGELEIGAERACPSLSIRDERDIHFGRCTIAG